MFSDYKMTTLGFIQERLESLNDIDVEIVYLLDNIKELFNIYIEPSRQQKPDVGSTKEQFQDEVSKVYSCLSSIAISLRKEVKIMDDNIGVHNKNEDLVMILPINVDKKNTSLGSRKLEGELKKIDA